MRNLLQDSLDGDIALSFGRFSETNMRGCYSLITSNFITNILARLGGN